jgi:hypothetical protein
MVHKIPTHLQSVFGTKWFTRESQDAPQIIMQCSHIYLPIMQAHLNNINSTSTYNHKGLTYMGIRMILRVSYGSSNQSALPETYYQFWIGQFGINTSCEMWWCNRWIWLIIRNLLESGLALAIPSPRVCILNVTGPSCNPSELCITIWLDVICLSVHVKSVLLTWQIRV